MNRVVAQIHHLVNMHDMIARANFSLWHILPNKQPQKQEQLLWQQMVKKKKTKKKYNLYLD